MAEEGELIISLGGSLSIILMVVVVSVMVALSDTALTDGPLLILFFVLETLGTTVTTVLFAILFFKYRRFLQLLNFLFKAQNGCTKSPK